MKASALTAVTLSIAVCSTALVADKAAAQGSEAQPAFAISQDTYYAGLLAVVPRLLSDSGERRDTGRHMVDAALMTAVLAEGLKRVIDSPRPTPTPDSGNAFPSGHASFAFAIAASLSEREPSAAYWAYPLAAAVGWSRHQLGAHTWTQVVGGAVLGTYVGRRAGRGQWHLFGHNEASPLGFQSAGIANSALLSREIVLWSSDF